MKRTKHYAIKIFMIIFVSILLMFFSLGMNLTKDIPVKIGNPTLTRYPNNGKQSNVLARSTWDMHYFNNRIYISSGNYWNSTGKTDVWIYNGMNFVNEFSVDEEIIFDFFEYDNKLFIPGYDATEDWSFGNLYINDPKRVINPGWMKLRTIPDCVHSFCVALFQNKLYANMTTDNSTPNRIVVSSDMGQTWETFLSKFGTFVVFPNIMFIEMDGNPRFEKNYYKFDGTKIQKINLIAYPNWTGNKMMGRFMRFRDGVLYAPLNNKVLERTPLFFLPESEIKDGGTATKIAKFATDNVRDIVVRDNTCFVMTAKEIKTDVSYKGFIYSSVDLVHWSLTSVFTVPGIPLSFEIMNHKFFVGLGSRSKFPWGSFCVGNESGSIWEIFPLQIQKTPLY